MLPPSIRAIVRDWLNANHIVLIGGGYGRYAAHALSKLSEALAGRRHVLKVMFVFSLMDCRCLAVDELDDYLDSVPLYADFNRQYMNLDLTALADLIVGDLERGGAVRRLDGFLFAA